MYVAVADDMTTKIIMNVDILIKLIALKGVTKTESSLEINKN